MNGESSKTVFSDLEFFLPSLYQVLEESLALAVDDFHRRGRRIEPYHLASGVRHEASERLLELASARNWDLSISRMDNNGLQISVGGYSIRVRKGELPPETQSSSLSRYYEQRQIDFTWQPGEPVSRSTLNLVLLWNANRDGILSYVDLALPGAGGVEVWRRPVPPLPDTLDVDRPETGDDELPLELLEQAEDAADETA